MPGLIHWMHDTLSSFRPGERNASLHRSQFESLSKQIPILHVSLITNTLIVSYIHAPLAPRYLWLYVPGVICLFCLARLILWRREQGNTLDDATIARRLRATVALAGGLGIVFTSWALNLYPYGGPYEQGQLAFYMSITVLGCYLSLTHVPASTFLLFITVILPFSIFFAASEPASDGCVAGGALWAPPPPFSPLSSGGGTT